MWKRYGRIIDCENMLHPRELLRGDWKTYFPSNQCANALACMNCSLAEEPQFFEVCSPRISHLLIVNLFGILVSRLITL
jgi:hypothetical protein